MTLIHDQNKVSWKYKGMHYEYSINNIFTASLGKKYIFIRSSIENSAYEVFTYVTLHGTLIASVTYKTTGGSNVIVKILDENNKEVLITTSKITAATTNGDSIFIIEDTYKKVMQYSIHGKKLKEYPVPVNYTIVRFFDLPDSDKEIKIICYGQKDKYEKDIYCLSLNLETGEWTVLYSMLDK